MNMSKIKALYKALEDKKFLEKTQTIIIKIQHN